MAFPKFKNHLPELFIEEQNPNKPIAKYCTALASGDFYREVITTRHPLVLNHVRRNNRNTHSEDQSSKVTNHQTCRATSCLYSQHSRCHGGGYLLTRLPEVLGFFSTAAPVRVSRKATISANSAAVSEAAKDGML